jgi:Na+/H+ antiporter NhaD/arsenite permease-like protein
MANPASRNFFLLWLFVAFLALITVAVSYFLNGEASMAALIMAIISIAMSFISRSKSRGPDE